MCGSWAAAKAVKAAPIANITIRFNLTTPHKCCTKKSYKSDYHASCRAQSRCIN
jgi:hypothetical protein